MMFSGKSDEELSHLIISMKICCFVAPVFAVIFALALTQIFTGALPYIIGAGIGVFQFCVFLGMYKSGVAEFARRDNANNGDPIVKR